MDKMGGKLYGFFKEQLEVQEKIEELRNEGFSSDHMYVIAKDNEQVNILRSFSGVHFSTEKEGEWTGKFKEWFADNPSLKNVFEELGFSREMAEDYNQRIENGDIFLFADEEKTAESPVASDVTDYPEQNTEPPKMSRKERRKQLSESEESLLLHEEQLEVHKERVQTGEININKRIVEEQQHMDIPKERDDVIVERRPVVDDGNFDKEIKKEPYQVGDELHIPVIEEKLVVTKREVVTEEIVITKRKVNDTEHITETVRREEVDVDDSNLPPEERNR